jgi:5-methylcytosine-specific restriction protein A
MLRPSRKTGVASGLRSLIDAGRIDLSVEASSLIPPFRSLFTDAERDEAQRRLDGLPNYARRRTTRPEANFPDEVDDDAEFSEGSVRRVTVNVHERDRAARAACIAKHGLRCAVCEMKFEERYGPIGRGFIHVHHKKPLALRRHEYRLRAKIDLEPPDKTDLDLMVVDGASAMTTRPSP